MELCHATVGQVIKGKDSQSALQLNCSGMKNIKNNRVQSPSKFFVVEDLKGYNPATEGALSRTSDAKIKNQIRLAMEYHELMLEICYYANKAFESQIFCSIMVSFLVTLFCLYGALYTVSNPIPGREDSEIIILLFFVREIVVHAIPALILVHICGKILKKADEVERIVYKMIRYNTNENLQSILLNFLLQTQNLKPKFSPYGLFEVNSQLITVVVGTITTYFVILIQFSSDDYKKG